MPLTVRWQKLLAGTALSVWPLHGQFLLLDRGLKTPSEPSVAARIEGRSDGAFLGDRFRLGAKDEVWVIDRLRTWGPVTGGKLGDRFEKVVLFGGLEADPPKPGEVDCDCHNLVAIQTATLKNGSDSPEGQDVKISRPGASVWQLDFQHLNWSVPGGAEIQFGVAGLSRSGHESAAGWSEYTVHTATSHQIRILDSRGKRLGPYPSDMDPALGFAVQVWGHLPATIEIRPRAELWEVTLHSNVAIDSTHVERISLRFGPKRSGPVSVHPKGADLVMTFQDAAAGIGPADLNACLIGRRQDGVPFEGCDLLKRTPR